MANAANPQRAWRAACPNCGAPVEFASAASPMAVCSFCRSTLARDGDALRRTGQSAELFDDHSPLQIGTAGRWAGAEFRIVGRLQLKYAEGSWNEWHALFDGATAGDGKSSGNSSGLRSGWLSEDNGRYVMAFERPAPPLPPKLDELMPGSSVALDGVRWHVASVALVQVAAAEGELPTAPNMAGEYPVADLRNAEGEVGTLDYGDASRVHWSGGRAVELIELQLSGLREANEKTLKARGVECPSCGTALTIKLESTKSITCHQCSAVVDVSQGVGGDLEHYAQSQPASPAPRIPLGATAKLALGGTPQDWQVVGYVEREEIAEDPEDEATGWREYLLYARAVGFVFLVDAEEGWSWAAPITGAPDLRGEQAKQVEWAGDTYTQRYTYCSQVRYVMGEFYWRLQRGERTRHADYGSGNKRLNREQTASELTWSAGQTVDTSVIVTAFKLAPQFDTAAMSEASPLSGSGMPFMHKLIIGIFALVLIVMLLRACGGGECDNVRNTFGASSREYQQCRNNATGAVRVPRTGGGSFGGYGSGGGGHK